MARRRRGRVAAAGKIWYNIAMSSRFAIVGLAFFASFAAFFPAAPAAAAEFSLVTFESTAYVVCDDRQGSGALLAGGQGYVLTAGHVVQDVETGEKAETCLVGFTQGLGGIPLSYFRSTVIFSVYDERQDRDFALLQLGDLLAGPPPLSSQGFSVFEGAGIGSGVTFLGFPSGESSGLKSSTGRILGFRRGTVLTDAPIASGYSGGPVVDANGRLVGIATRFIVKQGADGQETVEDYEAVDILSLENWLDAEKGGHDLFFAHADTGLVHGAVPVFRAEESPCSYVVRTAARAAAYCLVPGGKRLAFPTSDLYFSWYDDFAGVKTVTAANLAEYQLVSNMTFRAGSLLKVRTDPRVYFVADNLGVLRHVPSEAAARRLFGSAWASRVHDVPDAFFLNYRIGRPLE